MKHFFIALYVLVNSTVFGQHKQLQVGDNVPDITIKNQYGSYNNLYDNLGQTTIVHFWGSWSKACVPMNKYLGDLYQKHQQEGLVIFSVSIDKKARHWLEQINKQGLGWPLHGSDFKGLIHSKPAKDYGIFEVPSTFILDQSGRLIYFNPEKSVIDDYLKEQEQKIKVLPMLASDRVYLTKKEGYEISRNDTVILAGKGAVVNLRDVSLANYTISINGQQYFIEKVAVECTIDFQVNYRQKKILLSHETKYFLKNKNGNIVVRGEGDVIDYKQLGLKGKHDFYLEVENGAFLVKLW